MHEPALVGEVSDQEALVSDWMPLQLLVLAMFSHSPQPESVLRDVEETLALLIEKAPELFSAPCVAALDASCRALLAELRASIATLHARQRRLQDADDGLDQAKVASTDK